MMHKLGGEPRRISEAQFLKNLRKIDAARTAIDVVVLRQPGTQDEDWRVTFGGRITSPNFNSRGAAQAYADGLRAGRKPEFRCAS